MFFFGSVSRAESLYVHCKANPESLAQTSTFRNKIQNVSITYTITQPILELFKVENAFFQKGDYTVALHC
jgi:hypothetical protein